jgi:hypothetical protein
MNEIIEEYDKAQHKADLKQAESTISVVLEKEGWRFFKPLSKKAAEKYGYGTKWCTSFITDDKYFLKYSKEGVLIYGINSSINKKVAFFYSLDPSKIEFSVWDEEDIRIDTMQSGVPLHIVSELCEIVFREKKCNYEYFPGYEAYSKMVKTSVSFGEHPTGVSYRINKSLHEITPNQIPSNHSWVMSPVSPQSMARHQPHSTDAIIEALARYNQGGEDDNAPF